MLPDQATQRLLRIWTGMVDQRQEQRHGRQISLRSGTLQRQFGGYLSPALPLLSDQRIRRQFDIIEEHLVEFMRAGQVDDRPTGDARRTEEHTAEIQSLMRLSDADFRLQKKN